MMKKWIVLCLLLMLTVAAGAAAAEGAIQVAENERLTLFLEESHCGFEVLDRVTGTTWSSSMNDPTFTGKLSGLNAHKANSLLTVNVTNLEKGAGSITNAVLLNEKGLTTDYELIENGVRVHYDLTTTMISLDVEIVLDGEEVLVRVPYGSINAYGDFSVVSIDMMPFLCSGSDEADGFLFYPDGCGAILEFKDYAHYKELTQVFTVYGNTEKAESMLDFFDETDPTVLMPVYGISIGGKAMLAVVEDGAETSRVSVNSSNKITAISYVFANLQYRRGFDDLRVTTRSIKTYDKKAMETDYSIRLMFLPEGKNSYSDMAVTYRDYLMRNGLTQDVGDQTMALDLFMTAPEDGLLFDTQRTVTTLDQAGSIMDALAEAGVKNNAFSLKGWSWGGYGTIPDRLPVDRSIGSNRQLTGLAEKAEKMGSTLSLTVNFVEGDKDSTNFSKRNGVVYMSSYAILTNPEKTTFILSPEVIRQKLDEFIRGAKDVKLHGLRYERMGQYIAYNYNRGHVYSTAQAQVIYQEMLKDTKQRFGAASVQGGAIWAAPYVSMLTEVPYRDSGFQFTTRSVPFYQIAMHGLRPYTGTPGNLSSDLQREKLRWVELGYMPYFELTWGSTEALMYTKYQHLFTAQYTAWLDDLTALAKEFGEGDLAALRTAMILSHEMLAQDVYRVRYDNGCTVYVNYKDTDVQVDDVTVPAMNYLVTKGAME